MLRRRQKLVVTSAAVLGTFLGTVTMTAPAMASTHPATARPAATGTNIDLGFEGETGCDAAIHRWHYCLWYSQNLGGAMWGTNQQTFGTIIATYPSNGTGAGKPVRNDAASMADNTPNCNVTTWVDTNYTGDFNWLKPMFWGNLTSTLHNNEASISYNNCSS
jgi:Peptidase inhibitor family I36